MTKRPVTIKDIAKIAKVHDSTVSRALSNDPNISDKTKKRILGIAKELKYQRNDLAKSLRDRKTRIIGLVISDILNPFYTEVTRAIEDQAQAKGYNLMLCNSDYNPRKERNYLSLLMGKQVDGILIFPVLGKDNNLKLLRESNIPYVLMDTCPQDFHANYVYTDQKTGAYDAVTYLIERGHKDIVLYTGPKGLTSSSIQMELGYCQALTENNFKIKKKLIYSTVLSEKDHLEGTTRALLEKQKDLKFTAILCISDIFAKSVYECAQQMGIRIPDELSVIGYDDTYICPNLNPPLTSVSQLKYSIGQEAVDVLLKEIKAGQNWQYQTIKFTPKIVERGSVIQLKK